MSAESNFDDVKGRAKEAAGSVTGDEELKNEGKKDQAVASAKEKVEAVKDKATDLIDKARDAASRD